MDRLDADNLLCRENLTYWLGNIGRCVLPRGTPLGFPDYLHVNSTEANHRQIYKSSCHCVGDGKIFVLRPKRVGLFT